LRLIDTLQLKRAQIAELMALTSNIERAPTFYLYKTVSNWAVCAPIGLRGASSRSRPKRRSCWSTSARGPHPHKQL